MRLILAFGDFLAEQLVALLTVVMAIVALPFVGFQLACMYATAPWDRFMCRRAIVRAPKLRQQLEQQYAELQEQLAPANIQQLLDRGADAFAVKRYSESLRLQAEFVRGEIAKTHATAAISQATLMLHAA